MIPQDVSRATGTATVRRRSARAKFGKQNFGNRTQAGERVPNEKSERPRRFAQPLMHHLRTRPPRKEFNFPASVSGLAYLGETSLFLKIVGSGVSCRDFCATRPS